MSVLSPPPDSSEIAINRQDLSDFKSETRDTVRSWKSAGFRLAVFKGLEKLKHGHIVLREGGFDTEFGDPTADIRVSVKIANASFYRALAIDGGLGAAEAYQQGYWSCDDLPGLMRIFARNLPAANALGGFRKRVLDVARRLRHLRRRNTRGGSRRNIAAHYDLSNEFYELFLDDTMTYSSGVFPHENSSLRDASLEKYDRICRKLQLSSSDRVLEIGTGWGGFAVHAARNYGCHVTTTTISQNQFAHAKRLFASLGLEERITLLDCDYRDLCGQFDKLVSIEMIEAVGQKYLDTFIGKCSGLLKSDGLLALQAIIIPDQRYATYVRSVDFIQRYIFPGGCLPSLGALTASLGRVSDLQLVHLEDFAEHYARTLQKWRARYHGNMEKIRELQLSESFLRLWDYYLAYCEGAFREKQIGVSQLILQKPGNRRPPLLSAIG